MGRERPNVLPFKLQLCNPMVPCACITLISRRQPLARQRSAKRSRKPRRLPSKEGLILWAFLCHDHVGATATAVICGDAFRASSRLWEEAVLTPEEPPLAAITEAACAAAHCARLVRQPTVETKGGGVWLKATVGFDASSISLLFSWS